MSTPGRTSRPDRDGDWYEIRVQGHLDQRWTAWFDGLAVVHEPDGTTALRGPVADQAALHGLLAKVRDMGMPLISVAPRHSSGSTGPSAPSSTPSTHPQPSPEQPST